MPATTDERLKKFHRNFPKSLPFHRKRINFIFSIPLLVQLFFACAGLCADPCHQLRRLSVRSNKRRASSLPPSHVRRLPPASASGSLYHRIGHRRRRMGGVFGALFGGHRRPGRRAPAVRRHRGLVPQPSAAYDGGHRRAMLSKKYSYIPDTFTSLDQVPIHLYSFFFASIPVRTGNLSRDLIFGTKKTFPRIFFLKKHGRDKVIVLTCATAAICSQVAAALRQQGLESSNLILGIDFTRSNEWTGTVKKI
jgi:hypothetical protein